MTGRATLTESEVSAAYRTYGRNVQRRCLSRLRDESLAQDAAQEVFIRLLRYGAGFREAQSEAWWLYRVADRVCWDLLKRRGKVTAREQPVEQLDDIEGPADHGADTARRDLITRLFGRFDAKLQELAWLYFVVEVPQGEIGERLGWSRQTVNRKLAFVSERAQLLGGHLGVEA